MDKFFMYIISMVIAWFEVIFGRDITSDISKLLYLISRAFRRAKFEIRVSQNLAQLGGEAHGSGERIGVNCVAWKLRAGFNTGFNIERWDVVNLLLVGVNLNPVLSHYLNVVDVVIKEGYSQCFIVPVFTPFDPPTCVIIVNRKWVW